MALHPTLHVDRTQCYEQRLNHRQDVTLQTLKKNERDPDMHQTKKGNEWHFGMKAHIGVDAKSGLTHTLVTTAANEHDLNQLKNLLHGDEEFISGDAGYQGAEKREELKDTNVE